MFARLSSIAKKNKKTRIQTTSNSTDQAKILRNLGFLKFKTPIIIYYYSALKYEFSELYYTMYDSDGNL